MASSRFPWKGFLIGFIFGIAGIWILAMFSLAIPFVEYVTQPLFAPGRFFASLLITDGSGSSWESAFLFLCNGLLYGVVGAVIQWGLRKMR